MASRVDFDDVHFVGNIPDWRELEETGFDADDEELDKTPADVKAILGFDPKEFSLDSAGQLAKRLGVHRYARQLFNKLNGPMLFAGEWF